MHIYPPGTRIGQYEIAGRPLMGGMGIVYLCLDMETNLPFALKTFQRRYLAKPKLSSCLEQEETNTNFPGPLGCLSSGTAN